MVDDALIEEVGRQFIELAIQNAPVRERDRLRQALEPPPPAPPLPGPPVNPSFNDLIGGMVGHQGLTRTAMPFVTHTTRPPATGGMFTTTVSAPWVAGPPPQHQVYPNSQTLEFAGEFYVRHGDQDYHIGHIRTATVSPITRNHFSTSRDGIRVRDASVVTGHHLSCTIEQAQSGFLEDAYHSEQPIHAVIRTDNEVGQRYEILIELLFIERLRGTIEHGTGIVRIEFEGRVGGQMSMTNLHP
jgi:hypothetical protein